MTAPTQYVLNADGELEPEQPRTWDGEPILHPETVREGLFDPAAFAQMSGQLSVDQMRDWVADRLI